MKKTIFVFITAMMISGALLAQDVQPAIKSGAKSLNFTFGGLGAFNIGPTGVNNGLGMSYFLSSDAAVRLGLQLALPSSTTPANPPTGKPGTDGTSSAFTFGIGADYLMYMGSGRVRPYMGAGFLFGMTSTNDKTGTGGADGTGFIQTETKNRAGGVNMNGTTYTGGTRLGLMGIVGAELFVYNELSFSAEYQLNLFSMTSAADQVQTQGATSVTTKSPSFTNILGFGTAGATVHIYF